MLIDLDSFSPEAIAETEDGREKLVKASSRAIQAVLMAAPDEEKVVHELFDGIESSAQDALVSYSLKREDPTYHEQLKARIRRKATKQARVRAFAVVDRRSDHLNSRMGIGKAEMTLEHRVLRKASAEVVRAERRRKAAQLERDHNKAIRKQREEVARTMLEFQEERVAELEAEFRQKKDSLLEEVRQEKAQLASRAHERAAEDSLMAQQRNQITAELLAVQEMKRQQQIDLGDLAFKSQSQQIAWKAAFSAQAEAKEASEASDRQMKAAEKLKADSERERERVAEKEAEMKAGLGLKQAAMDQREKKLAEKEQKLKIKEARLATIYRNNDNRQRQLWDNEGAADQREKQLSQNEHNAAARAQANSVAAAQISKDKELLKKKELAVEAREKKVSATKTQLAAARRYLDEREPNWTDSFSKWLDVLETRPEEKLAALGTDVKETSVSPSQSSSTPSSMASTSTPATSPSTPSTPLLQLPGYLSSSNNRKRKLDGCVTVPYSKRRYFS